MQKKNIKWQLLLLLKHGWSWRFLLRFRDVKWESLSLLPCFTTRIFFVPKFINQQLLRSRSTLAANGRLKRPNGSHRDGTSKLLRWLQYSVAFAVAWKSIQLELQSSADLSDWIPLRRNGCISYPSVGLSFTNIFQNSDLSSENVGSVGHLMCVVHVRREVPHLLA